MATMAEQETAKPPVQPLPLEPMKYLSVAHPTHGHPILVFGCRTQLGTSMVMSRLLVHQAATIVAQTEGFLSRSKHRESQTELIPESDALIASGKYYFHANDIALADYIICADFDAWEPPAGPDELPEPWRTLTKAYNDSEISDIPCDDSLAVGTWIGFQDKVCMLTGIGDVLECQHIVPQEHATWAKFHNVLQRATGAQYTLPGTISHTNDDIRGLVAMDPFSHRLMSTGIFCPFPLAAADGTVAYVAYYISPQRTASGVDNHLRTLSIPARISPYLLYVRFAWSIFKQVPRTTSGVLPRKPLPAWAPSLFVALHLFYDADLGTGVVEIDEIGVDDASLQEEVAPSMISDTDSMCVDDIKARERNFPPDLL